VRKRKGKDPNDAPRKRPRLVPEQGQTFSAPGDAMEVEELGKIFINNNDTKDTNDNDNLNNDDRNHDDSDSDGKTGSQEIQQSKRRLQPETPLPQIKRSKRMADKSPKHKSRRHQRVISTLKKNSTEPCRRESPLIQIPQDPRQHRTSNLGAQNARDNSTILRFDGTVAPKTPRSCEDIVHAAHRLHRHESPQAAAVQD
jgi:hypothetical protein